MNFLVTILILIGVFILFYPFFIDSGYKFYTKTSKTKQLLLDYLEQKEILLKGLTDFKLDLESGKINNIEYKQIEQDAYSKMKSIDEYMSSLVDEHALNPGTAKVEQNNLSFKINYCSNCGNKVEAKINFCSNCGKKL